MSFKVIAINKISESWGDSVDDFWVQAHCEIEEEGQPGGEAIIVNIASPKALESQLSQMAEPELGRGYVLMLDYDERLVLKRIQTLVDKSGAETWEQLQAILECYFDWI